MLIGLGNPGHNYHETRHNIGFRVIQRLAEQHKVSVVEKLSSPDGRPAGVYGDCEVAGQRVRLLMPLTMMNESGEALRGLREPSDSLMVICDDVNLPLGVLRMRAEGGAGGHNGLISCLQALGTEAVPRLRLGVGVQPLPSDLREFVLGRFSGAERPQVGRMLEQAAEACETWVREGIQTAMNRYNRTQDTG